MLCEVCGKRIGKTTQFCSRCKSSVDEVYIFGHKFLCYSKNEKGYDIGNFYCEVILTEKRLVAISDYKAGSRFLLLLNFVRDVLEDNPLIDLKFQDIIDVKVEIQDELFGTRRLTILTNEKIEHCFLSLPKWFMLEIEKHISGIDDIITEITNKTLGDMVRNSSNAGIREAIRKTNEMYKLSKSLSGKIRSTSPNGRAGALCFA